MIGVYYIATGKYVDFFETFIQSVDNWMPEHKKIVCLIGDLSLSKWDKWKKRNVSICYQHINHYPWPVVTLYKIYLMKLYKIKGVELHFFFNANVEFTEYCLTFDYSQFFKGKIIVTDHVGKKIRNNYLQGCALCIPDILFDDFCKIHNEATNYYMQKKFKVPKWHDETITNKILIKDKQLPYEFFDTSNNLRWMYCDVSPAPKKGLCYISLANKGWQNKFKGWV